MASPQKENGYTAIANELLEKIYHLPINGSEFRILLMVARKTYGYNKKYDTISLSQLSAGTGLNRPNVCKTIKSLVVKRLLIKTKNSYSLRKNYDEWVVVKRLPPVVKCIMGSSQMHNEVVVKRLHTKDIYTKDNITKEINTLQATPAEKQIPLLMKEFEEINPTINYGNTTQRKACLELIKKFGLQKAINTIKYYKTIRGEKFSPVIATPYQLQQKMGELMNFYNKKQSNKTLII